MEHNTTDIHALEVQVDELIAKINSLTIENTALRGQQDTLISERAELIEKTELAKSRIEAMISRLKAMETNT